VEEIAVCIGISNGSVLEGKSIRVRTQLWALIRNSLLLQVKKNIAAQ
jgi:hypothetical protein